METKEEESLKEKLEKLEVIESVYVFTTFFIGIFLFYLGIDSTISILEIIRSNDIVNSLNDIVKIIFIYLIILIEIIGFLVIHSYNRKPSKEKLE